MPLLKDTTIEAMRSFQQKLIAIEADSMRITQDDMKKYDSEKGDPQIFYTGLTTQLDRASSASYTARSIGKAIDVMAAAEQGDPEARQIVMTALVTIAHGTASFNTVEVEQKRLIKDNPNVMADIKAALEKLGHEMPRMHFPAPKRGFGLG